MADQVRFYKGSLSIYQTTPSSYANGIFFDTTNHEIYLNNVKYSVKKWSYLDDASVVVADSIPYLALDFDTYLGDPIKYVKLPQIFGHQAIDVSVYPETGDSSVFLKIDNSGNSYTWLTQSANGLKFAESIISGAKVNGKGILTNPWITAADVSVGSIPTVNDSSLTIGTSDTVAVALQKVKRLTELFEVHAFKTLYVEDANSNVEATLVTSGSVHNLHIKEGSYINIQQPSGDTDNRIVISTTLQAGDNVTISDDGKINAEEGTYWQEID